MKHSNGRQVRDKIKAKKAGKKIQYTFAEVEQLDRNARAYGWEVGHGQPIKLVMETTDGNPFMNENWRGTAGLYKKDGE